MDPNELKDLLIGLKNDINELKSDVKKDMKNLELAIDSKLNDIVQNNLELKSNLAQCEQKLLYFDREMRKRNLLFFGIEEKENNYLQLESTIINLIKNEMRVDFTMRDIDSIRRIGRKSAESCRPVLLSLVSWRTKIEIMKNKECLRKFNYALKEDFSKEVLETRRNLQPEVDQLRKEGKIAVLRHDKIKILGNKDNINSHAKKDDETERKRQMSTSPEKQPGPIRRAVQPSKGNEAPKIANRTGNKMHTPKIQDFWRHRSNSTSDINSEYGTQRIFGQNPKN